MLSRWASLLLVALPLAAQAQTASVGLPFVEPLAPFVRSALVVGGRQQPNRARRGVLVRAGAGVFACFDPDLLRWSVVWRTPEPTDEPITRASMAAVSYPDAKAKAHDVPRPVGELLCTTRERVGANGGVLPLAADPRRARLSDGRTPVGPLPPDVGQMVGVDLCGFVPVLRYQVDGVAIREVLTASARGRLDRTVAVAASERAIVLRLADAGERFDARTARVEGDQLPLLSVHGAGVELRADAEHGVWLVVQPGPARTFGVVRSIAPVLAGPLQVPAVPAAAFPARAPVAVAATAPATVQGPLSVQELALPDAACGRAVRPMDVAFLADGTMLLVTLDGDVWRVEGLVGRRLRWRRVAAGLFESTAIEVDAAGRVYVLGRDQVTELVDVDADGVFDRYDNAADGFLQSLNTRDYAMSMVLEPDGSFLVAKGGIDDGSGPWPEMGPHRGAVLRLRRDGRVDVLGRGMRLPYVGRRKDGAVFASDQQGHWIPSTPIYRLADNAAGVPEFGFVPTRHAAGAAGAVATPVLWFPYRSNRSGAGFATLDRRGFPSLADRFVQIAWDGRVFVLATPADGVAFGYRLPVQLSFPSLNGDSHPETGTFYVAGIGISGYRPMTERFAGLAAIRQVAAMPAPVAWLVEPDRLVVRFGQPVPEGMALEVASLKAWDIRRTRRYGSGHFRWDGQPGEHALQPAAVRLADGRRELRLDLGGDRLFRSSILHLHVQVRPDGEPDYALELFCRPAHLERPDQRQLAALRDAVAVALEPGEAARGAELFQRYACAGCHSRSGERLVGPPLDGVATRHAQGLDAFLRESILQPGKQVAKGYAATMPSFEGVIPPQDVAHLIAYLRTLR